MTRRRCWKAALVTLLVGFCALESLAWARLGLVDAVRGSSPIPAVFRDGTAGFYSLDYDDARPRRVGVRVWSADGTYLGEDDANQPTGLAGARFRDQRALPSVFRGRRFGVDRDFETARFLRRAGPDAWGRDDPARDLNSFGGFSVPGRPGEPVGRVPMHLRGTRDEFAFWSFEAGRFVLRRAFERTVLLVVGPDGVAASLDAPNLGQFGRLNPVGNVRLEAGQRSRYVSRFLELDATRLVEIEVGRSDDTSGVDARVRTIRLTPAPAGGRPDPTRLWYAHFPNRAIAVDSDGRVWSDVRAGADERIVGAQEFRDVPPFDKTAPRGFATASLVDAGDPLVAAVRFRIQTYGEDVRTWDLAWRRQGVGEETLAALACVPAVLRPIPLAAASFVSGLPTDGDGGSSWWWRDPVLAGQRRPIVLGTNLLLAVACAFVAWRVARVHCATSRAAQAWTLVGFLLGPLGLLLLRLLAVRAPAETVGAGRRSLALETCPATDTPWPSPARTGREIFVDA